MADRDVQINLVGRDQTGRATRSAARNLDQLANKIDKFNAKTARVSVDTGGTAKLEKSLSKVKVDKNRFATLGRDAGRAFSGAVANAIADGTQAVRKGIVKLAARAPAVTAGALLLLGTRLAGLIGQGITAALGLALGPALLAGPIAFLLKQQLDAAKQVEASEKRIASLKKRLEAAKSKDVQDRLRKEIAAEQRILAENEKQAEQWNRLKSRAKSFIEFISAPLKLPLADALDAVGDGLDRLKKPMRDITEALGPALAPFTTGIMNALVAFIEALKPALPGIVAGMKAWAKEAPKIAGAVGDMIAKIVADPEKVTNSVTSISQALQDFASFSGMIVSGLTSIGDAWFQFSTLMDAFETGDIGGLGGLTGKFREFTRTILEEINIWVTALDNVFGPAAASFAAPKWLKDFAAGIHSARVASDTELAGISAKWAETDRRITNQPIIAKIEAENANLETKIAASKILLDTVKNKKTRAKITADIADMELKVAIGNAKLVQLGKKVTKPKIQATIADLEAKVRAGKRALKGVHDSKTEAKIKGNIAAAEAAIRKLKGLLKAIPDEQVNVNVNPVINFSAASLRRMVLKNTSGGSWGASLSGGGDTSRTGGPMVNVEAPNVSTRVFLDSREIAATVRSVIVDENKRNAYRAKVGRR